jgi:hypothetical protein
MSSLSIKSEDIRESFREFLQENQNSKKYMFFSGVATELPRFVENLQAELNLNISMNDAGKVLLGQYPTEVDANNPNIPFVYPESSLCFK